MMLNRESLFRRFIPGALIAGLVVGWTGRGADANLLSNGSFETPVAQAGNSCGPYSYCLGYVPGDDIGGWIVVGKGGVAATAMLLGNNYTEHDDADDATLHFTPEDGNQSIDLTGEGNQGIGNGIKETIATIPGTAYQLTFFVGHQYDQSPGYAGPSSISLWLDLTGTGAEQVGLYSNSADILDDVSWTGFTYDFVASGDLSTIAFLNATDFGNNFAGLDNVSLIAELPEPAIGAIFVGGAFAALWARRRSRAGSFA